MWSILAIGVYITFRILGLSDLSCEGVFPLGAAIGSSLIVAGVNPVLATLAAFLGGSLAGSVTGVLNTKMGIPALIAGILVMTGLYSVNLRIMGQANLPLLGESTILTWLQNMNLDQNFSSLIVGIIFVVLVIGLLVYFMNTQKGLALRATGDNQDMAQANGIKTDNMKIIGYMISNGLIALSGALIAQNNGYSDIAMGTGTIVIGLAAVVIAEVLLKDLSFGNRLITIVLGSTLYRLVIDLIMRQNLIPILPSDIKILSAIALALILWLPQLNKEFSNKRLNKVERG